MSACHSPGCLCSHGHAGGRHLPRTRSPRPSCLPEGYNSPLRERLRVRELGIADLLAMHQHFRLVKPDIWKKFTCVCFFIIFDTSNSSIALFWLCWQFRRLRNACIKCKMSFTGIKSKNKPSAIIYSPSIMWNIKGNNWIIWCPQNKPANIFFI